MQGRSMRLWSSAPVLGCLLLGPTPTLSAQQSGPVTRIELTDTVIEPQATRPGINLGDQNFYDSGQMQRNLVFRNPGFEGMTWRSILHCSPQRPACTDLTGGIQWPAGFWTGGHYQVMLRPSGQGNGAAYQPGTASGIIQQSVPTNGGYAVSAGQPGGQGRQQPGGQGIKPGDWLSLTKDFPDDPDAGWWTTLDGGARLSAERNDLSPDTTGHQALRIDAADPGQSATVLSYFDSTDGHAFLRLHGSYQLRFRARPVAGSGSLDVTFDRIGRQPYFHRQIALTQGWRNYVYSFPADESPDMSPATARLSFQVSGASLLLDDVSLEAADRPAIHNLTAFRDAVVETLRDLHPGVLRMMASDTGIGATIDNLLATPLARQRAGYSVWSSRQQDIPSGIPEFLDLCAAVGADPWIVLPTATDAREVRLLAEYLAQPANTTGGHLRAAEGRAEPWTAQFHTIHLELGNEAWNGIFHGEAIDDPLAYGDYASSLFAIFRQAAGSQATRFDLVVNAQTGADAWITTRDRQLFAAARSADTLAIAPYLMHRVDHADTPEELFAPLLAEPEFFERNGLISTAESIARPRALAVYEVNLHSTDGLASQSALLRLTPSLAAGLAVTDQILRMKRDNHVRDAMVFGLPQFEFRRADGKHVRLWGSVVDMGPTMRRRPLFLAEAMVNRAVRGDMVRVSLTGANPTHPVLRGNDGVSLPDAHDLDAFAFREIRPHGTRFSLIVYNLSLTASHTIRIAGPAHQQPAGTIASERLWNPDPAASNEDSVHVKPEIIQIKNENIELPPCSLTTFQWTE